jgi:hypothetical protein
MQSEKRLQKPAWTVRNNLPYLNKFTKGSREELKLSNDEELLIADMRALTRTSDTQRTQKQYKIQLRP